MANPETRTEETTLSGSTIKVQVIKAVDVNGNITYTTNIINTTGPTTLYTASGALSVMQAMQSWANQISNLANDIMTTL